MVLKFLQNLKGTYRNCKLLQINTSDMKKKSFRISNKITHQDHLAD